MTDDAMTGAQFRREVGTDPQRWAREFLVAYADAAPIVVRSDAERLTFVTTWFRDAMNAAAHDAMSLSVSALSK
jgi:hypothetical protein